MTQDKLARNQSIECARLVASFFVVFIHCPFPGMVGGAVGCVGSFAVSMFFAISGFFCYRVPCAKILDRMKRSLALYLVAELSYLIWNITVVELKGGSSVAYLLAAIPEIDEVAQWLFMNVPPYNAHLWYLLAASVCYFILWLYTKYFDEAVIDYRPLYLIGCIMLADSMTANALAAGIGEKIPMHWFSTALRNGLPMFALGIFLRENLSRIQKAFALNSSKLFCIILAGTAFSLIQWLGKVSTGIYFGTIMQVVGLLLLLNLHPVIVRPDGFTAKRISHFGYYSMVIYILHIMVIQAYEMFAQQSMERFFGQTEPWLRPILVLGLSFLVAIIFDFLRLAFKHRVKQS